MTFLQGHGLWTHQNCVYTWATFLQQEYANNKSLTARLTSVF